MGKRTVLMFGPGVTRAKTASGGIGGYTRNMAAYLETFQSHDLQLKPCYHTVALNDGSVIDRAPVRLVREVGRLTRALIAHRPAGVHILGRYRNALPRELLVAQVCRRLGIGVLYEVKAGAFEDWYREARGWERRMVRSMLEASRVILCEGMPYLRFVRDEFGLDAHYFPNFVPAREIPAMPNAILGSEALQVLFVGAAHAEKGVFELVRGCQMAAEQGATVSLRMIGYESEAFKAFLDAFSPHPRLEVQRLGRRPHAEVLEHLARTDVLCAPSAREGHSNVWNEAMMHGLVLLTTRVGFAESVLSDEVAIFLDGDRTQAVGDALMAVTADRERYRGMGKRAYARLVSTYSSTALMPQLEQHYRSLL